MCRKALRKLIEACETTIWNYSKAMKCYQDLGDPYKITGRYKSSLWCYAQALKRHIESWCGIIWFDAGLSQRLPLLSADMAALYISCHQFTDAVQVNTQALITADNEP